MSKKTLKQNIAYEVVLKKRHQTMQDKIGQKGKKLPHQIFVFICTGVSRQVKGGITSQD